MRSLRGNEIYYVGENLTQFDKICNKNILIIVCLKFRDHKDEQKEKMCLHKYVCISMHLSLYIYIYILIIHM